MKIAFLLIGTNKYIKLARNCADSLRKHVKIPNAVIDTHIFSNLPKPHGFHDPSTYHTIDHLPWPLITLLRYHYFTRFATALQDYDYLYYIDADMEAVNDIGPEILGTLVGCQHPGLWGSRHLPYDPNVNSTSYFKDALQAYAKYYFGALQGGKRVDFLKMADILRQRIDQDLKKNYIALWHDESQMNKYFFENPPDVVLDKNQFAHVDTWFGPVTPNVKIRTLDKNHDAIRQE
ncbi:MAG TPA: hypothetical protein PLD02_03955 [Saprospiraceae bacterium]|nr:hypothetical protein [Saprospiraceae bacterium]